MRLRDCCGALLVSLLLCCWQLPVLGQDGDTLAVSPVADSVAVADTLQESREVAVMGMGGDLDAPVNATAKDSIKYALGMRRVRLYGEAKVNYQNKQFEAAYIDYDMDEGILYARGVEDSVGNVTGKPVYTENGVSYTMREMVYNVRTGQARIQGVMTQVSEGYMHAEIMRKLPDDVINVKGGKFTTCEEEHPHFFVYLSKAKVIPGDKIFVGPSVVEIADVPTPLVLPFGFFPNTTKRASGIIMPEYGEEINRGFFLRNGGLYLGLSDYFDVQLLGGYYSKGSWEASMRVGYNLRYRFTGSFGFDYSSIKMGYKGASNYQQSSTYMLTWSHSQDRRTHPNSNFSASVTFGSSGHNRYNSQTTQQYLNNQMSSSIAYSRQFPGTPFSLSLSLNHSQSTLDSVVNLRLPQFAVSMARIYPFKRKGGGKPRWYERIGLSYNFDLQNMLTIKEKRLFTKDALRAMRNGIQHKASTSTSFNLLKYINISPSINYDERWYIATYRARWDEEKSMVTRDTVSGFARAWQFNTGVSASTKVYGMFVFSKKSFVRAIRHVITPSVGLSYHPDFSRSWFGMFDRVQDRADGHTSVFSRFDGTVYGGPSPGQSGTISLSLGNNLEMKIKPKSDDTTATERKIPLLESFSLSTGYNMLADSMNWSSLSLSARTRLWDGFNVSLAMQFSPYACTDAGSVYNKYYQEDVGKPLRFENLYLSLSMSLNKVLTGKGPDQSPPLPMRYLPGFIPFGGADFADFVMVTHSDFSSPWNLSVNYNFSYSVAGLRRSNVQSVTINGGFTLAQTWSFNFSTGYDISNRRMTMTSMNVRKDLHCWEMSANIVPFGSMRSYFFRIGVKAGVLQDLKYQKNASYLDNIAY